jgi:uncharacterized damage-inducible protein DinB
LAIREEAMNVRDLETLYDHGSWANRKLLGVVAQLTPEQFARTVDGTHGSVRNTLVHMLNAESLWLSRMSGKERIGPLDSAAVATTEPLIAAWKTVEIRFREWLKTLADADLARKVEFTIGGTTKLSMSIAELFEQTVLHGVHHRGQVSLLLRLLGMNPENFDILLYFAERRASQAS